jgi:hypothetical protein
MQIEHRTKQTPNAIHCYRLPFHHRPFALRYPKMCLTITIPLLAWNINGSSHQSTGVIDSLSFLTSICPLEAINPPRIHRQVHHVQAVLVIDTPHRIDAGSFGELVAMLLKFFLGRSFGCRVETDGGILISHEQGQRRSISLGEHDCTVAGDIAFLVHHVSNTLHDEVVPAFMISDLIYA